MDREQQAVMQQASTNAGYIDNSSFMMMRVNTTPLIEDIKNFLSSKENMILQDDKGTFFQDYKQVGTPLANSEGIMKVCNIVKMTVNQHTAQGNLKDDHYWSLIERARKEITETVIKKCYDWDIEDSDLNTVIDEIMRLIEIFLTRPVDNKERDSYGQQFTSKEVIATNPKRNAMAEFSGGIGK